MQTWPFLLAVLLSGCFSVPDLPTGDPRPGECVDCGNADFCDGDERCVDGVCVQGDRPCPPGQECDEANNRCLDGDASPPPDRGPRLDRGPRPDARVGDAGAPPDCCDGEAPETCQSLRCVGGECVAAAVADGVPCGPTAECRAGACEAACDRPSDCGAPVDPCQRPTCEGGVCGVTDCPGDVCDPDGCQPCSNGDPCDAAAPCHRSECVDGYCGTFRTPEAPCDDGDACFDDDRCGPEGDCRPGNTPMCGGNMLCVGGLCSPPPGCASNLDCVDDDRPICSAGTCVQCTQESGCGANISPICRDGECVCDGHGACVDLEVPECTFPSDCATTGSIQRGICVGQRCEPHSELANCGRRTDGRPCNNQQGQCLDGECLPALAEVTLNCPSVLTRARVACDGVQLHEGVCGGGPMTFECPRGGALTACCSSDVLAPCVVPPNGGGLTNVRLTIHPGLDGVNCAGPADGNHRQCTGTIRLDPTVSCRPI